MIQLKFSPNQNFKEYRENTGKIISDTSECNVVNDEASEPYKISINFTRDFTAWDSGNLTDIADKTTVLACKYLGTMDIYYKTSDTESCYKIKVYYEVRNCDINGN